jgi:hypothetical protein
MNNNEMEDRKIIGWFRRKCPTRAYGGCKEIKKVLTSAGVSVRNWLFMRWQDYHGVSSRIKRFEIVCKSRDEK